MCEGDQLLVYESRSKNHQEKPIATVIITKVLNDTSHLRLSSGSVLSLKGHSNAAARLSKMAKSQCLKVFTEPKDRKLAKRVQALDLCILSQSRRDAHIAISIHHLQCLKKQLCFVVVDENLLNKGIKFKPRFVDDTDEDLAHVIAGLSHYYRHLTRTSDPPQHSIDGISVSFFQVRDTGSSHPRIVKIESDNTQNLCKNNVIDISIAQKSEAPIYGLAVNVTDENSGTLLYPVLFYFDHTEFTISKSRTFDSLHFSLLIFYKSSTKIPIYRSSKKPRNFMASEGALSNHRLRSRRRFKCAAFLLLLEGRIRHGSWIFQAVFVRKASGFTKYHTAGICVRAQEQPPASQKRTSCKLLLGINYSHCHSAKRKGPWLDLICIWPGQRKTWFV